ncbi:hypothetical protein G7B40_001405 [Aetokthonos hydrillicola Thurmond2011]|uniref:Uncharacterized protein n=1 Tax=Aetokthonos hydrillicola Thurmond2011 TaxID=2712845 RepID=A0AAP5I147_9CYAN|nr:hypothetical protein [Aetokthonos hydrillicola]MBO3463121.1 hypothetical protein [Aetokthonos hydrillicola CCALA 1050]MBW4591095.1 hypothetical protein [Aetokthonos hydrillicola CCALA 1050]MDR9893242.1 hypothetical protein [Aetokthonos hydrillicola Thurmond2011]
MERHNACNAFHTINEDLKQTSCVDFELKDKEKQRQRNAALQVQQPEVYKFFETIFRQKDYIECSFNIKPKYVLLSFNVASIIDKYFYQHFSNDLFRVVRHTHLVKKLFDLEILTDAKLPKNFIQVIVPIEELW